MPPCKNQTNTKKKSGGKGGGKGGRGGGKGKSSRGGGGKGGRGGGKGGGKGGNRAGPPKPPPVPLTEEEKIALAEKQALAAQQKKELDEKRRKERKEAEEKRRKEEEAKRIAHQKWVEEQEAMRLAEIARQEAEALEKTRVLRALNQEFTLDSTISIPALWNFLSSNPEELFHAIKVPLTEANYTNGELLETALLSVAALCSSAAPDNVPADMWALVQPLCVPEAIPMLLQALQFLAPAKAVSVRSRVKKAASAAVDAIVSTISNTPNAVPMCVPALVAAMDPEEKWETMVGACETMVKMCAINRDEMGRALPSLMPPLIDLLGDTKKQVKAATKACLDTFANDVVTNDDIKPLIPALLSSYTNHDETTECIHQLASTTFVQIITAAPLAMVAPLLVRGLNPQNKTALKRQCAVIISNMSKLVEEPAEAMPFLFKLEPMLKDCASQISDEEARNKCGQSHEQLLLIQKQSSARAAGSDGLVNIMGWADRQGVSNLLAKGLGVKMPAPGKKGKKDAAPVVSLKWPVEGVKASVSASSVMDFAAAVACSLLDERCDDVSRWGTFLEKALAPIAALNKKAVNDAISLAIDSSKKSWKVVEEAEDDDAEVLCDTTFTLAFGSKILLHNTKLKLQRGKKYGLVGGNDSGKTSLLRAIANEQIDGFPDFSTVRTTFVEADISPDLSNMTCVEYVMADERIISMGIPEEKVREALNSVGFVAKKDGRYAAQDDEVNTLSGGWRMKVALARAMLHRADILLMDEPTNHLDVINVQWVLEYLKSLTNVTAIMVSTHKQLLTDVAQYVIQIDKLKLNMHKGNLDVFVKNVPTAKSYFEIAATTMKFKFPDPSFIEGVKSKGKALMKMRNVEFTYPINDTPTLFDITVQVSLASRVACVGRNGAGKSTMVKLLTGELEASTGECWQHPACRCAYVAQHAFHHIENHVDKTANEYIRWRYQYGEDREAVVKKTMVVTDEEMELCMKETKYEIVAANGSVSVSKRAFKRMTGLRRKDKKSGQFEYEVVWNPPAIPNTWERAPMLVKIAKPFEKMIKVIDTKEAAKEGMYQRPLTQKNVEQHLDDVGLEPEFGTHNRISALSGGQKVKVVIAAAMWNQPHIVILDEPTNYLDRESLGALAHAIQEFDGGVVIISHNDDFCSKLCKETWVLELGHLDCKGDAEWMKKAEEAAVNTVQLTEMVDGGGNTVKLKNKGKNLSRKERKMLEKTLKEMQEAGEDTYDIEDQLGYFDVK